MNRTFAHHARLMFAVGGLALLAGCELPLMDVSQTGYRGTGMVQVQRTRVTRELALANVVPPPPYELEPDTGGDRARDVYENVQVLGDLSADEFNRLMISITEWVAPEGKVKNGGCNYCHNPENMASDEVYTKVVARRMLQMNLAINQQYKAHVQNTGVTCWTCHRGQPLPANVWVQPAAERTDTIMGNRFGQNRPNPAVAYSSLPGDYGTPYLLDASNIRVAGEAFPGASVASIKDAEATYGLMMHMSSSLGVNCTYCHNTRNFRTWESSNPQRVVAWHGLRMVRALNSEYVVPLTDQIPAIGYDGTGRKGPMGDIYKINCTTCHQGAAKPLLGVSMLKDHPALAGPPESAEATILTAIPAGVTELAPDPTMSSAQCRAEFAALLGGTEILFDTDSAAIQPASVPVLDRLAALAGRCSDDRLVVEGHTDITGSQRYNVVLSRDRAASVANYLISKGVRPSQLGAIGYGESRPRAGGGTEMANMVNRRIEVEVLEPGGDAMVRAR